MNSHAFRCLGTLAAVLVLHASLPASPLVAQEPADSAIVDDDPRTEEMVVAGVLGGGIGLFLGGFAGAGLEMMLSSNCFDYCGLGGGLLGAALGESMGMAFGVHAGNRRRGGYMEALAGPVAVIAGSLLLAGVFEKADVPAPMIIFAIPTAQLMTSIAGERGAMERRQSR